MTDSNIEAAVLWWCKQYSDRSHHYVMRNLVVRPGTDGPKCGVIDMLETEPVPGGYSWETRKRRHAEGNTWEEVARKLTTTCTRANIDSLASSLPGVRTSGER